MTGFDSFDEDEPLFVTPFDDPENDAWIAQAAMHANRQSRIRLAVGASAVVIVLVALAFFAGGTSGPDQADSAVVGRPDPSTVATPAPSSAPTLAPSTTTTAPPSTTTTAVIRTPAPLPAAAPLASEIYLVTNVVDGDTIDVDGGTRVRLIGIDTPERGQCGYDSATAALAALVAGRRVALIGGARDDTDRYGRLLRYVEVDNIDVNLAMIQMGHAVARYDSLDGYGRHPRQDEYRAADQGGPAAGACSQPTTTAPPSLPPPPIVGGGGGGGGDVYYANCTEARRSGLTPLYAGQPGYRPALDRDKDGVACE